MMPNHLILIRHGESEGNVAGALARSGDESLFTEEFVTTPGHRWGLTTTGIAQAQAAGAWLRAQFIADVFGSYEPTFYVSPYVRTRQTAGHLGLVDRFRTDPVTSKRPSVRWHLNRALRERDWGDIETIPRREFDTDPQYANNVRKKTMDPLYWRPPGGESLCDVAENRVRNFLDTLHRERSDGTVVAVSHGEFIRATRLVLERADDETYATWERDLNARIRNCEVLHYTRVIPDEFLSPFMRPGWRSDWLSFVRSARPVQDADGRWSMEVSAWRRFSHLLPTNDELLGGGDAPEVH